MQDGLVFLRAVRMPRNRVNEVADLVDKLGRSVVWHLDEMWSGWPWALEGTRVRGDSEKNTQ